MKKWQLAPQSKIVSPESLADILSKRPPFSSLLVEGVVMGGCAGGEYVGGLWADEWDDDDLKNVDDAAGDDELTDT